MTIKYTSITFLPLEFAVEKYVFRAHIDLGETNWLKIKIKDPTRPMFKRTVFKTSKMMHFLKNRDSLYTKLEADFVRGLNEIDDISPEVKKEIILAIRQYFMNNLPKLRKSIL
ncbi:hypothetical protein [Draconibacterium mangrovi]|uniref:hypothetical protein n=1 Tax=Draconibacterium mangrovi TaxID=2697469 RepID=UPI0013D42395|nr:hypothetical protein [Draconibacterium mangrovi]